MEKKRRTFVYLSISAIIAIAFIGLINAGNSSEIITGKFTDAGETRPGLDTDPREAYVEKVYWDFGNKTVEGRIARHNFSNGIHNVTVTLVKSNGENETHKGQVEVR